MKTSTIKYELQNPIEHLQLNPIPMDIVGIRFKHIISSDISNNEINNETIVTLEIIIKAKNVDIVKSTAVYIIPNVLVFLLKEFEKNELLATLLLELYKDLASFIYQTVDRPYYQMKIPEFETLLTECSRFRQHSI